MTAHDPANGPASPADPPYSAWEAALSEELTALTTNGHNDLTPPNPPEARGMTTPHDHTTDDPADPAYPAFSAAEDALIEELAALTADGPDNLFDRIAAHWVRVPGPVGELYVASTDHGIAYVRTSAAVHDDATEFTTEFRQRFSRPLLAGGRPPAGLLPALHAHRVGKLRFDLRQLSEFERAVLLAVLSIPRGQVRPYAWVASQIGKPRAVRAVGSALGRNPVPVLIPCHRVVRSDGSLGDYVFTPPVKRALLDGEGTNIGELYELGRHGVHYLASDTTGVVCFPTCPNARRITEAHRQGFRSMRHAEHAGYHPCQHCRPVPAGTATTT